MTNIYKGLCWATAILFLAVGNWMGWIEDSAAQTMFMVIPIIAVLSLRDQIGCRLFARREA